MNGELIMKLNKLLNGVLACTMTLSMVSVVGAMESDITANQPLAMVEDEENTSVMVLNENTGLEVTVECTSNNISAEKIQEIVNSISIEDEFGNTEGVVEKITVTAEQPQTMSNYSFANNKISAITEYSVLVEWQPPVTDYVSQFSSSMEYDSDNDTTYNRIASSLYLSWQEIVGNDNKTYRLVTSITGITTSLAGAISSSKLMHGSSYSVITEGGAGVERLDATPTQITNAFGSTATTSWKYVYYSAVVGNNTTFCKVVVQ